MPRPSDSPDRIITGLRRWRSFASSIQVNWAGRQRSWEDHIKGAGYVDEQRLIQPTVFPAFAQQLLGYDPNIDLAAEETGHEGTPDFTPADAVTHPFVFETKGTSAGVDLAGFESQLRRYLTLGRPRIRKVVLTNLVGIRVFDLDGNDQVHELYRIDLRALLFGEERLTATTASAIWFATFLDEFAHRSLTRPEKIEQIRAAPEWNELSEVTSSDWVLGRLDRVVRILTDDVARLVASGVLQDQHLVSADERRELLEEIRLIGTRLGLERTENAPLSIFLEANPNSDYGKAVRQYCSHVAYYAVTRLTLVRVWEDLGLLDPMLHDGGFDRQMERFDGIVPDVVDFSFRRARERYRSLFDQRNAYTWYTPSEDPYVDVIYELANTYLGKIRSDVLGQVYERMLERVDRKLRGQYYTPRDIISLIWDLINISEVASKAEAEDRQPYVLDIATGSGGFLVEAARRLRERLRASQAAGAGLSTQTWLDEIADGLNGIELQRFSAYLAELNLLVQLGQVVSTDPSLKIPSLGILSADTLALHEPDHLFGHLDAEMLPNDLLVDSEDRRQRAIRLKAAAESGFLMDVACGNPPYVGEKLAAPLLRRTRSHYPYWEQFVGQHMDYLYWFLILGLSKLRQGGRFGFITTEYWLRAAGASPLRRYMAERCHIERIVLFRDFRLFEDAPGQHSMIVVGTRVAPPDLEMQKSKVPGFKPRVSIYEGGAVAAHSRRAVIEAMRDGKSSAGLRTFTAPVAPNALDGRSWADIILTSNQLAQRRRLSEVRQLPLIVSKGVETTVNTVTAESEQLLSQQDLAAVGGPGTRAGIQLLKPAEVASLGALTEPEKKVVRPVINTRDVYPYATVLPDDAPSIIYLAKPEGLDSELTDEQIITGTAFPSGLPKVESHLNTFRTLLEHKTRDRNERRPWWTLHRPRANVVGDSTGDADGWAPYCLTTRWGGGSRLVVGLAPAGTSPASGLHVLRPGVSRVSPAYLAALFNSTLYQEAADTLPPGQLRQQDLESLGLPDLGEMTQQVAAGGLKLAKLVVTLVRVHGPRWPLLPDALRADVALRSMPDEAWVVDAGPEATWGPLSRLAWISSIERHRAGTTKLGEVQVDHDLFGLTVHASIRGQLDRAVTVHLGDDDQEIAIALAARLRGLAETGGCVRDVDSVWLPVDKAALRTLFSEHRVSLAECVQSYHQERAEIDNLIARALS